MLLEACEGPEQAVTGEIKAEHGVCVFVEYVCVFFFVEYAHA